MNDTECNVYIHTSYQTKNRHKHKKQKTTHKKNKKQTRFNEKMFCPKFEKEKKKENKKQITKI